MRISEGGVRRIIREELGKIYEGASRAESDDAFRKIKEICDAALSASSAGQQDVERFHAMIMSVLGNLGGRGGESNVQSVRTLSGPASAVVKVWRDAWASEVVSARSLAAQLGSIPGAGRPVVLPESSVIVIQLNDVFLAVPSQQDYELCEKFFESDRPPGRFSTVVDLEQPAVFSHAGSGMVSRGKVRIHNG